MQFYFILAVRLENKMLKCIAWFKRYMRYCTAEEIKQSFISLLGAVIFYLIQTLMFDDKTIGENIRPRAETCFKFLYLSRNYTSFSNSGTT